MTAKVVGCVCEMLCSNRLLSCCAVLCCAWLPHQYVPL